MSDELFPQWRNANDKGKYPFLLSVTMTNGTVILPDSLFADARLYPIGGNQDLYLSRIVKNDSRVTFYVSDSETPDLASGYYLLASPPELIRLEDRFGREAGVLVTDPIRLTPIAGWAEGTQSFSLSQTAFAAAVVTPMPTAGVRSLRVDDDEALFDDVYLIGGRGVTLDVDDTDPTAPKILVHAVGELLFKRLLCSVTGFVVPCFLETINGNPPDAEGNFYIGVCGIDSSNTILRVEPIENGLNITTVGKTAV